MSSPQGSPCPLYPIGYYQGCNSYPTGPTGPVGFTSAPYLGPNGSSICYLEDDNGNYVSYRPTFKTNEIFWNINIIGDYKSIAILMFKEALRKTKSINFFLF